MRCWRGVAGRRPGVRGRGPGGARGQSTVEFALVFPFFLLLFLGMIELGNAWMASSAAAAAARDAAELARRDVPFNTARAFTNANQLAQERVGRWVWDQGFVIATAGSEFIDGQRLVTVTVNLNYNLITGRFLRTFRFGASQVFGDGRMRVVRSASALVI